MLTADRSPGQWKPGCRQVSRGPGTGAHRSLGAGRVGAPGVLFTDPPANPALSLHLLWPNNAICLKKSGVICDLLKSNAPWADLAVSERDNRQVACHSDRHAWLSVDTCSSGSGQGPSRTKQIANFSSVTKYRQCEECTGFSKTLFLSFVRTSGKSVPWKVGKGSDIGCRRQRGKFPH